MAGMKKTTHTTNYYDTFIEVAPDCPARKGEVPPAKEPKTVAQLEYELLAGNPYRYTSDDTLFSACGKRQGKTREDFFAKGQACFRGSPLAKRYGWGVHSDSKGRIALFAVGSSEYRRLARDKKLKHLKALRSKRGV